MLPPEQTLTHARAWLPRHVKSSCQACTASSTGNPDMTKTWRGLGFGLGRAQQDQQRWTPHHGGLAMPPGRGAPRPRAHPSPRPGPCRPHTARPAARAAPAAAQSCQGVLARRAARHVHRRNAAHLRPALLYVATSHWPQIQEDGSGQRKARHASALPTQVSSS